jgi:hypothetical protein
LQRRHGTATPLLPPLAAGLWSASAPLPTSSGERHGRSTSAFRRRVGPPRVRGRYSYQANPPPDLHEDGGGGKRPDARSGLVTGGHSLLHVHTTFIPSDGVHGQMGPAALLLHLLFHPTAHSPALHRPSLGLFDIDDGATRRRILNHISPVPPQRPRRPVWEYHRAWLSHLLLGVCPTESPRP